MTNETTEQVAVPDGWKLVPVEPTQEMATAYRYGTLLQNRNAWRAMLSTAPTPPAQQPVAWVPYLSDRADGVKGHYAIARHNPSGYREVWNLRSHRWAACSDDILTLDQALELMQKLSIPTAPPAQQSQSDMNAAIDRMRRENNLSIDGDNSYKRDLLDCVIGALAFGKQGSAPPPEDHWLHQFWEIGDAERRERDAAPPAQQSQWVPSRKQLPPLDIPVWLSDEGRGVFIGMRSSSTDGWLWAECDAYRFFGGQWESIEAHFDDFEPSCWMPLPAAPGDAAPLAESGAQVDELAQLVAKLVQALRKANPDAPLAAKAVDYLRRKRLLNPLRDQARGDTAAPEQAEQPHPVNRSVIRDVFLRNGFTIKEGHDDLKPYVYAAAEELLALDGKEVVTEQDAVKVPRGLLERLAAGSHIDPDCCVAYYREQLRALLRGDV